MAKDIEYSEKYCDDFFEYRYVILLQFYMTVNLQNTNKNNPNKNDARNKQTKQN